jgi:hypothetical protein
MRGGTDVGVDLILRLTAVELLLRPMGPWGVRPLILAAAGLAILLPRALSSSVTWYVLTALLTARIIADWPLPDNHIYLLTYWCLSLALALDATDPARTLATSARWLIGTAFLMAVIWKALLSPDYLDGRFFRVTWLTDGRFTDAVQVLGHMTAAQLSDNREQLAPFPEGAEPLYLTPPPDPAAFRYLVLTSTWGVLALEALVAFGFLFPRGDRAGPLHHLSLLLFCGVTYAIAPVAGFGWLLLTMGIAMCRPDQRALRAAYVVTWFLVLFYSEIPWASVMVNWLSTRSSA